MILITNYNIILINCIIVMNYITNLLYLLIRYFILLCYFIDYRFNLNTTISNQFSFV